MNFLKWLGLTLLSILVLLLVIPLFLPSDFHVERSIIIERHVDVVFTAVTNMKERSEWDPWIEMEPDAKMLINMTPNIIGSGFSWKGEVIGEGKLKITEFLSNRYIKSKIEFISPQKMEADVLWSFDEMNGDTKITWAFEGTLSYPIEKWYGIFLDKSMGPQFEKGLSNLKQFVEKIPDLTGRTGNIKTEIFNGLIALTIKDQCSISGATRSMISNYSSLRKYFKKNKIEMTGYPFTLYHKIENNYENVIFEFGFQIDMKIPGEGDIRLIEIPKTKTVMASHYGHFKTVTTTHFAIKKYIEENGLEQNGEPWELYISNPLKEPNQSKWETRVYFPIK